MTAVDDAVVEGAHTGSLTHTAVSTDLAYNGIVITNVTPNISDNDSVPPKAVGGEGSHEGSTGPGASTSPFGSKEGGFGLGFDRTDANRKLPILEGPFFDPVSRTTVVRNVSHGPKSQAETRSSAPGGSGLWLYIIFFSLLLLTAAVAKARY